MVRDKIAVVQQEAREGDQEVSHDGHCSGLTEFIQISLIILAVAGAHQPAVPHSASVRWNLRFRVSEQVCISVWELSFSFSNDQDWFTFYFYADALMYLIYLLQYPAVLVHIEFLISDTARNNKKRLV